MDVLFRIFYSSNSIFFRSPLYFFTRSTRLFCAFLSSEALSAIGFFEPKPSEVSRLPSIPDVIIAFLPFLPDF